MDTTIPTTHNPEAYKVALPAVFTKKTLSPLDQAVIVKIGEVEISSNQRKFKRVEFMYVRDLSSTDVNTVEPFIKNIFGPLMDAEGAKELQKADALWDSKFPVAYFNAEGKSIAHPKAGQPQLQVGEIVPIAEVTFDTTEYPITSKGFDGVERTNKVKKLTVVCLKGENPLAVANGRMNRAIVGADGKPTGQRLGGYVTGINHLTTVNDETTGEVKQVMEFIPIPAPSRVAGLLGTIITEAPTAESFKSVNVNAEADVEAK